MQIQDDLEKKAKKSRYIVIALLIVISALIDFGMSNHRVGESLKYLVGSKSGASFVQYFIMIAVFVGSIAFFLFRYCDSDRREEGIEKGLRDFFLFVYGFIPTGLWDLIRLRNSARYEVWYRLHLLALQVREANQMVVWLQQHKPEGSADSSFSEWRASLSQAEAEFKALQERWYEYFDIAAHFDMIELGRNWSQYLPEQS